MYNSVKMVHYVAYAGITLIQHLIWNESNVLLSVFNLEGSTASFELFFLLVQTLKVYLHIASVNYICTNVSYVL